MTTPSKDFLATRLASGTAEVSKIMSWWPRHIASAFRYLEARMLPSPASVINEAQDAGSLIAHEWETGVPSAKPPRPDSALGLMVEHTVLEFTLVEAVVLRDTESIEFASTQMLENAVAQAGRYNRAIKDFPKSKFQDLVNDHIDLFIQAVQKKLVSNLKAGADFRKRRDENATSLAAFTGEWF